MRPLGKMENLRFLCFERGNGVCVRFSLRFIAFTTYVSIAVLFV